MDETIEAGRLFGIPIYINVNLFLLALLFGYGYFTSGSLTNISYGVLLFLGVIFSVLVHELGHAFAARFYGVSVSHIELNGLGGYCAFSGGLPFDRIVNIAILLAGPAATLLVCLLFSSLATAAATLPNTVGFVAGTDRLYELFWHLGFINSWLFIFNMLPSHPLDGGRTLAHILSRWLGYDRAMRAIAFAGCIIIAWLVWQAFQGNYFALLIAFLLFQANMQVLDSHGGPRWRREN